MAGSDVDHADVGLALLRADLALTVYDGKVPNGAQPPFVLVYTIVARPIEQSGNALNGLASGVTVSWYCHSVGETTRASLVVADRVRAALLNQRPTVAGRSVGLIRQDQVLPPDRDESTGRLVMDAVSVYTLHTQT